MLPRHQAPRRHRDKLAAWPVTSSGCCRGPVPQGRASRRRWQSCEWSPLQRPGTPAAAHRLASGLVLWRLPPPRCSWGSPRSCALVVREDSRCPPEREWPLRPLSSLLRWSAALASRRADSVLRPCLAPHVNGGRSTLPTACRFGSGGPAVSGPAAARRVPRVRAWWHTHRLEGRPTGSRPCAGALLADHEELRGTHATLRLGELVLGSPVPFQARLRRSH